MLTIVTIRVLLFFFLKKNFFAIPGGWEAEYLLTSYFSLSVNTGGEAEILKYKILCLVLPLLAFWSIKSVCVGLFGKTKRCNVVQNRELLSDPELKLVLGQ